MKINSKYKNILLEFICFLYILLFVYAAMSKLLVFDEFKIQIGQSAMLTPFTSIVAWAIPSLEILIALLLIIPRFKLLGLFAAFNLMVMFTAYIFIILNFSNDVPCSCGGVIEKLGWTEHLIFNIAFVILAFIGILIINGQKNSYVTTPKYALS
ncbi:MauE/DoxX family redox-associated membrane protein [Flavivirga algicola]|nr:MauE/DoxX family redox-associated membrane protein [Flavivirga algicola]